MILKKGKRGQPYHRNYRIGFRKRPESHTAPFGQRRSIKASTISSYSSSRVTCTSNCPNTTRVGTSHIVVTNPNGLSGEFTNYYGTVTSAT